MAGGVTLTSQPARVPRRRRARTLAVLLALVAVVALMVLSFTVGLVVGSPPTPAPSPTVTPRPTPTRSPTPTVLPGIAARGIVVPQTSAELGAPITAIVEAVFVSEGDEVRDGQLLMRLDTSTRRAAVDVAEADLERALAAADRAQTALEQLPEDATDAQRETAEADVRLAEAELSVARRALTAAQVALRQTEIRAPAAGTVAFVALSEGEQAAAGQHVLTVADMSAWLIVTTDVSELDVVSINAGDAAVITFAALPGVELDGVVDHVRVRGTSDGGGVEYEIVIEPQVHLPELRWTMSADVRILPSR